MEITEKLGLRTTQLNRSNKALFDPTLAVGMKSY